MSRDFTPKELHQADLMMGFMKNPVTMQFDNGRVWKHYDPDDELTKRCPNFVFLSDNEAHIIFKKYGKAAYPVFDKIEKELTELIEKDDKGVPYDRETVLAKWYLGKLDPGFYYHEQNNLLLREEIENQIKASLFDVVLKEKTACEGLSRKEAGEMRAMLSGQKYHPVEIDGLKSGTQAIGFITLWAAEVLKYDHDGYSGFEQFIADILDGVYPESDDGTYSYYGHRIWIDRKKPAEKDRKAPEPYISSDNSLHLPYTENGEAKEIVIPYKVLDDLCGILGVVRRQFL